MVELKLKSWGTFDLQVLACRENVAVALVLKIWEYWNANCHICCLSTDHAPLAEAILPQQDLHQGFLLGQLGGKWRVVLGTMHGLRLTQENNIINFNVSSIPETFIYTLEWIGWHDEKVSQSILHSPSAASSCWSACGAAPCAWSPCPPPAAPPRCPPAPGHAPG